MRSINNAEVFINAVRYRKAIRAIADERARAYMGSDPEYLLMLNYDADYYQSELKRLTQDNVLGVMMDLKEVQEAAEDAAEARLVKARKELNDMRKGI